MKEFDMSTSLNCFTLVLLLFTDDVRRYMVEDDTWWRTSVLMKIRFDNPDWIYVNENILYLSTK